MRTLAVVVLWIGVVHAEPDASTSELLRQGNTAALAGDWSHVSQLIEPLLLHPLAAADLAEAHRLAGLAALFQQHGDVAERHFLAYLRIAPTGRLDPALYPPEAVTFFSDVASRHAAELGSRPSPSRSWWLTLIPPFGQLQNEERTKAYALGGVLGTLLVADLTSYYFLSKWCAVTDGPKGGGLSCYNGSDHNHEAARLRPYNIASGIGVIAVYAYGVVDGILGYRRRSRELAVQPFVAAAPDRGTLGIIARF
ncbi:MAG TPA: hypothetical protein VF516_26710 [Kofleriaceae bacterium]